MKTLRNIAWSAVLMLTVQPAFSETPTAAEIVRRADEPPSATEIVRRADELNRGLESYSIFTMEIIRPEWKRSLSMEAWTQGTTNSFIRVLEPKKEKDVTFLKKGREAWQFVPSINRTIKIPPSMMLQSWMGSDFTNDDVVRADSMVVDYTHKIVREETFPEGACWVVESIPKPEAPVVWNKVVLFVYQDNFVARRAEYFDDEDRLVKYYETADIQIVEDIELALEFTMYDVLKKGHRTRVAYDQLTFKPDLKADTFSKRNLRR